MADTPEITRQRLRAIGRAIAQVVGSSDVEASADLIFQWFIDLPASFFGQMTDGPDQTQVLAAKLAARIEDFRAEFEKGGVSPWVN